MDPRTVLLLASIWITYSDGKHSINVPTTRPLVIAHRGASGRYPEMTPISFQRAVDEGADMLECDICVTRDLQLVCSHESWMDGNTNADQVYGDFNRNTYFVQDQGRLITDHFTVDFTLDDLTTWVGKRQRYSYRDPNHDEIYPMASVHEVLQIIQSTNRTVAFLGEIKDRIWVNSLDFIQAAGTTIEDLLLDVLAQYGLSSADSPAVIQCFNEDSIHYLSTRTDLPLAFLVGGGGVTDEKLAEFATYAYAIGATKSLMVTTNSDDQITGRTDLVERAHAVGLEVNAWTFRNEDRELAWDYGQDPWNEYEDFLNLNVDGFITDFPETAVKFLDSVYDCGST